MRLITAIGATLALTLGTGVPAFSLAADRATTTTVPSVVKTASDGMDDSVVEPDIDPVAAPDTAMFSLPLDALPLGTSTGPDVDGSTSTDDTTPPSPSPDPSPSEPTPEPESGATTGPDTAEMPEDEPTTPPEAPEQDDTGVGTAPSTDTADGQDQGSAAAVVEADPDVRRATVGEAEVVGVSWTGEQPDSVEVRARETDGEWTPWELLEVTDPSGETTTGGASEPLFIGEATEVDVRVMRAGAPAVTSVSLVTVDPASSTTDAQIPSAFATAQATAFRAGSVSVITREQWGADPALMQWTPRYAKSAQTAVLHHTAGSNDYAAGDSARIVRGIYAYHSQTRGWGDIGYNVLVDKYGQVFEGRAGGLDRAAIGSHTGGYNTGSFGVSMIGTYDTVVPPAALKESVARIMAWKLGGSYQFDAWATKGFVEIGHASSRHPVGTWVVVNTIFGHRDVSTTGCPGNAGYAFLHELRNRVNLLTGVHRSAIWSKWTVAGGAAALGYPSKIEYAAGVGSVTDYDRGDRQGSIVWSQATGTHVLINTIRAHWLGSGGVAGLGYPKTDETVTADGRGSYAEFLNGAREGIVLWSPSTGAQSIGGSFLNHWRATGGVRGMGYPLITEARAPDGVGSWAHFSAGGRVASILWHPTTGTHSIGGPVRDAWLRVGGVLGPGYPTVSESATPDKKGSFATFRSGSLESIVLWSASTGAHHLNGPAYAAWQAKGGTTGVGFPTEDERLIGVGKSTYVPFADGDWIVSNVGVGAYLVPNALRTAWYAQGGPTGSLGLPIADATGTGPGLTQAFAGGTLSLS
ncbi:N-acetylmuramoyl-L-alanine amidase [Sanguibacter sp. 25GB23B1]|uniref:N-acetylmuramoyl-L-alanine amidase n=1 Tax=unclassified Sanguibacter TaxID=2645534 RepID=UPI0032AF7B67